MPAPAESSVPGSQPDPATTRVGSANLCPGCQSARVRTICGGEDTLYRATERSFLIVECAECRMVRLYPRPTPEELRRYYPDLPLREPKYGLAGSLSRIVERLQMAGNVRFVRNALKSVAWDGPVLDVGCGDGRFLRELNLPHDRIVGLDFSVDAASEAWGTNAVPAVCGALPAAPFAPGVFAAITMFQVLEHLYDPLVYVQTAAQLLHPDGRLIIQVPNAGSWQFLIFGERWSGLDIPRHLLLLREDDLINLLDYCGFEVVHKRRICWKDDLPMFATSVAPSLNPELRWIRRTTESRVETVLKTAAFGLLCALAAPFAVVESLCHAGATLTVEARLKHPASAAI